MKKGIVAFTGYNTRAVVAFCRFLKSHGLRAHLIAKNSQDPIFLTAYGEWVCLTRESYNLDINQCIEYFKTIKNDFGYKSILLAPTSEYLNRFFLDYQESIQKEFVSIPLVNHQLYKNISDKYSFRNICHLNGFNVPGILLPALKKYPFVAKKKRYDAGSGHQAKPYLIFNDIDYQNFYSCESDSDYYFEKYIEGESYYLLYHISHNGVVSSYSQRNVIQQAAGRSIIAARPADIHVSSIGKQYSDLFKSLDFHGLVMVELRKCHDTYFMIEANPRFWGPLQFIVDNYPLLLKNFLLDQQISLKEKIDVEPVINQRSYFWYGGYVLDKIKGQSPYFHQYDQIAMNEDLPNWLASDVFLQEDSICLFNSEINGLIST